MKLCLAMLTWVAIGTILGVSLWIWAVKGSPWLLAASALAFIAGVARIGCQTH